MTLRGVSLKGKNRIREFGSEWELVEVMAGNGSHLTDQVLVVATSDTRLNSLRWIKKTNDPDFEIISEKVS